MKKQLFYPLIFLMLSSLLQAQSSTDYMQAITNLHQKLTSNYFSLLNNIDSYLSDNQFPNKSYRIYKNKLHMILSFETNEDGRFKPAFSMRSNFILPQTKEKLQLVFDKYTKNDQLNKEAFGDNIDAQKTDEKIKVGLKMYLIKEKDRRLYAQLGAKLSSPFGLYLRLNGSKHYYINDWHIELENDFYYYIKKNGLSPSISVDFKKPLTDSLTFQERNTLVYQDEDNSLELQNVIWLHQIIDKKQLISYSFSYDFLLKGGCSFCSNAYRVSAKYTRYIKPWLYFNAIPEVSFTRENHFNKKFSFTFNLGMILGR